MPINEAIVYSGKIGGVVLAAGDKYCIIIDTNATKEEAQATIKWAREALNQGKFKPAAELFGLENIERSSVYE